MNETTNTRGAIATASNNKPAKANKPMQIKDYIKSYEREIAKALPSVLTPERFSRIATTAVTQNPALASCTPQSFIGAMLTAASMGLEVNSPLGHAYLIPYGNNCQFQLGYRGMIELAHRSGDIKSIEAHVVYANDEFDFEFGLNPKLKHKPAKKDRGDATWVYAVYRTKDDGYGFEVMSVEDINRHRAKYSKAKNSPWDSEWEGMAKKTVLKRVLKYAPLKTEFVRAMASDETTTDAVIENGDIELVPGEYTIIESTGEVVEVK
jgi:recombination protein RecT